MLGENMFQGFDLEQAHVPGAASAARQPKIFKTGNERLMSGDRIKANHAIGLNY